MKLSDLESSGCVDDNTNLLSGIKSARRALSIDP